MQIPGVQISVLVDGKPFTIADDGCIGPLDATQIILRVEVEPNRPIFGFTVDGKKHVIPKKDVAKNSSGKLYQLKISVRQNDRGQHYTNYPDNNVWLVEQWTEDPAVQFDATGMVRIWEVGVISQNGLFFLTVQATYTTECYCDNVGTRSYPQFVNWPKLNEYLVSLLPPSVVPGPLHTYEPDTAPSMDGAGANEGIVQWYNDAQGLGCVATTSGNVRVHWSQIAKRPRRAYLRAGDKVRFKELRAPMQTSTRATSFSLEARGIELA